MPFEVAFLVLLLTPEFYKPLRELGVHRHAGMEGSAAADSVSSRSSSTPARHATGSRTPDPSPTANIRRALRRRLHVSGKRGGRRSRTLTLALPAGTRTALVGRSGSGKSTLVNLLMRFVDPEAGTIRANGVEITDLPAEVWRENLALVPQRPHLFHGSVLENIRLARPDASREEIEAAAELAGAAEFIRELPDGYETQVGERGARLSGGEAQRIAIARAFLKDAPVLDHGRADLRPRPRERAPDPGRAGAPLRGRTVLVVAHRLNTVYGADRIAVLDEGRLAETGTHAGPDPNATAPTLSLVNAYGTGARVKTFLRLVRFLKPHFRA